MNSLGYTTSILFKSQVGVKKAKREIFVSTLSFLLASPLNSLPDLVKKIRNSKTLPIESFQPQHNVTKDFCSYHQIYLYSIM